jgi:DNA-directed RNA polymerase subunit RPC12/RpoP
VPNKEEYYCSTCEKWLPQTREFFYTNRSNKRGFQTRCKKCQSSIRKLRYAQGLKPRRVHIPKAMQVKPVKKAIIIELCFEEVANNRRIADLTETRLYSIDKEIANVIETAN